MDAAAVFQQLQSLANPIRAGHAARYFKTGPGQYGEGDVFLGLTVPEQRRVANQFRHLPLDEVLILLQLPYHECRLTALFVLVTQYRLGSAEQRRTIFDAYLAHSRWINNWDLVDSSASYIVGDFLGQKPHDVLKKLAKSKNMWERRIAMLACLHTIRQGEPDAAFAVISILKSDPEELIQKAVGWMLREIGKHCSRETLIHWLLEDKQYATLPRTTLRYAIEHFEPSERQKFLRGTA